MRLVPGIVALCAAVVAAAPARGSDTRPVAGAAREEDFASLLGEPFSSRAAGLSFRPPAGATPSRRLGYGADIVTYTNAEDKWQLRVSRMFLEKPARLLAGESPGSGGNDGIVDQAVRQILLQNAAAEILRKDVINVGPHDVGLVICRFVQGGRTWLRQQAFFQANNRLFYVFDFTTPSTRAADSPPDAEDAAERLAAGVFRAMLDTVRLLDQRPILADNDERLYRTRTLMVNLPRRIQSAVLPEQCFRVLREGKDIGWMYVCEEVGEHQGKGGFFVATLSHGLPEPGTTVDVACEMFCMLDLKKADEAWVTVTVAEKEGRKQVVTEIGQSAKRVKPMRDETGDRELRLREVYNLSVTQTSKAGSKSVTRDLPPYYLPQAIGAMLPRLVPTSEAKGYLFMWWVSAEQEIIYRYIDVEPEKNVTFNGRQMRAAVVTDRIGLEGDPTFHYISPEGRYLGSHCPATGITMVACDMQTLTRLWPGAVIARPHVLNNPPRDEGR